MDQSLEDQEILVEFHLARIYGGYYKGRVAIYPHPNAASYDHVTLTPIAHDTSRKSANRKHRFSKATRKFSFGGTPKSQKASVQVVTEEEGEAPVLEHEDEVLVLEQEENLVLVPEQEVPMLEQLEEGEVHVLEVAEVPVLDVAEVEPTVSEDNIGPHQVDRLEAKFCELAKEN